MSFDTLGLSEKVLAAVTAAGYREPTPIQSGAIPHVLARQDVLGIAQTGTGKTASFVLPMLTMLEQGRARARMPRTLILEPTRELAAQVEENFVKYGINHKLNVALLIGGVSFEEQLRKLSRGVDVLIATPGRLLDLSERGKLLLQGVEILVIDEADRMLDMGFIPDIERICKLIPPTRQTLFFSATMPPEITRLADNFLKDPVRVEVSRPASTALTVTQHLVATGSDAADKRDVLRGLMRAAEGQGLKNAIIFCNRKRDVATLFRSLEKHGFSVGALHGDMDQRSRTAMLDGFRKGAITFLVASDVAARGLDIPDVSHVFNFDVPHHAEDYVHRIGRTGRAGRSGAAYTLVTGADSKSLSAIEKLIGNPIAWDGEPAVAEPRSARGAGRGTGRSAAKAPKADRPEKAARPERSERPAADTLAADAPVDVPTTDEAAEPAPRRRRSRGAKSAPAEAAATPAAEAPARPAPVRPVAAPEADERPAARAEPRPQAARPEPRRDDGNRRDDGRRGRRGGRDRDRDDDAPVLGLGDHVPAFLLRPVRAPRVVEVTDEDNEAIDAADIVDAG